MKGTLIHSYIEDIAKRIHDPILYGAASVMVGAGFSKNADVIDDGISAPNWEELAVSMFETLYQKPDNKEALENWEWSKIKKTSGKNVLKLAEEYKVVFGRNKLNQFIEFNINDDKYLPGELHKKLLELNWRDVFTTNYDTLLERTIDKINVRYNYKILTNQNDLPGSTHPRIIKLHGSVDSAKHYIICEEDYRTYPVQYAPLVNTVQQAMLETQLCLIGFSGDDPNFLSWLGWLRDNMGENCPTIYLVGLFYGMSEPERMTLESQNITIVDLGDLFDHKATHQEALDELLNKLIEYGLEKQAIYEEVPYKDIAYKEDFYKSIDSKYFEEMDAYLSKLKNKTTGYMAFPSTNEIENLNKILSNHFNEILKLQPGVLQINTLSKIVFFLRRMYSILEDSQAAQLNEVMDYFDEKVLTNDKVLLAAWVEMALYLLEMYRVDGRNKEHNNLLSSVEKFSVGLDGYVKEELKIEKCKFLISIFDNESAQNEIDKICDSTSLDLRLKKVFLYKQIGKDEKGIDLLRKASAVLAQERYPENQAASLKGYLNLCARSLLIRESDESFSDKEFYLNPYNVRNIYNQIKNDVSNSLLLASNESKGKIPGFNPGTFRVTYSTRTRTIKEQDAISKSLKYIMFQDLLCLPNTFSDHTDILALALENIIQTSAISIWKWSSIIRTNDAKIINVFFTRELIVSSKIEWVEDVFDQLLKLADRFKSGDRFRVENKVITQETVFDILSRLSIVMDDDRVIKLIEKIFELSKNLDELDLRKITEFFSRIRYSINPYVLLHYFYDLLESDSIPLHFLFEFADIQANIKEVEITDATFEQVIAEIKSEVPETRDRGIIKTLLINQNSDFGGFKTKIIQAIWEQKNKIGFPKTNIFYVWIWYNLPYPDDIDLDDLYMQYLKHLGFTRSVNGGTISGGSGIDNSINEYIQCFKKVAGFNGRNKNLLKVSWTKEYFFDTVKYIYEYLDNEKRVLNVKMDIFGIREEGKKRFIKLGGFVAMLVAQAYLSNVYAQEMMKVVYDVKQLLNNNGLSITSLDVMEKITTDSISEEDIESLMNRVIIGSREELHQAMIVIGILLVFEEKIIKNIKVSDHVVKLISSLKYFDITRSNMVISQLISVINHPLLIKDINKDKIIRGFAENLERFDLSFNEADKELIDTIYSLSILIKKYYDELVSRDINISEEFYSIISKLSQHRLKEVRYMFTSKESSPGIHSK